MRYNVKSGVRGAALLLIITGFATGCSESSGPRTPSAPRNVSVTLTSPISAVVKWVPNPDNEDVISYSVFRNAVKIGQSGATSFIDNALEEQKTYAYTITATSRAGVESPPSLETSASMVVTPDVTRPTVASILPARAAADVSPAATISVVFSEPMDAGTFNNNSISLKTINEAPIAGNVTYTAATHTAEFKPASTLPNPIEIVVTVSNAVKDLAGNSLAAPYVWSFRTRDETPPVVIQTLPPDGRIDIATGTSVLIAFSETIAAGSITSANIQLQLASDQSPVAARLSYSQLVGALITPVAPLAPLTRYLVHVSGLKDVAGNTMVGSFTSEFTTAANP